ncbi:MAG: hypothetical protein SFY66_15350 [Oculatellaceae cyanobacterium bins.114]|nr:hypothetical protein [Oculatellaceae cyanobacterium bins.114]
MTVHPSAAIAPGVLLQADLGARIMIAAGVSIGAGSILHAHEGILAIDTNACLGSGVLLVGNGKIGANACIGSMTTIFNGCVEAGQVVPPESLIGDRSRQIALPGSDSSSDLSDGNDNSLNGGDGAKTTDAVVESFASQDDVEVPATSSPTTSSPTTSSSKTAQPDLKETQSQSAQPNPAQEPKVYGLDAFNQMMAALFPHRQALNQPLNQTTSALDQASE